MIIDGKTIAQSIIAEVANETMALSRTPKLGVVTCAPGIETKQYLDLKRRKASEAGIQLIVLEVPATASTEDCIKCVERLASDCDGVLVQLPLPKQIDREKVLSAVPVEKDPDGFGYGDDEKSVLPPVVAAIDEMAKEYEIAFSGQRVVILGRGRLVGQPSVRYATRRGSDVVSLTEESTDYETQVASADILITGVGKPHFITQSMVKRGVVVFDAGASEDGGLVVGDVHPEVADVASFFTPVPGGIGPVTVATLLRNLITLIKRQ